MTQSFVSIDAGTIASTLIDEQNRSVPFGNTYVLGSDGISLYLATGPTGLEIGTIEATRARDREYDNANVGQSVVDLTALLDGFDFEVVPQEDGGTTVLGTFNVYARLGSDKPGAKFEYGSDTLANVRRFSPTTQPPINFVRVIGANGLVAIKNDEQSIAQYGLWPIQVSASDVDEQTVLDDKATALLRPRPFRTIDLNPDPALAPRPWDDFWLGDTVHVTARRGALTESAAVRVNAITVAIDDNGYETYEVPDPQTPDQEATLKASLSVEVTSGD